MSKIRVPPAGPLPPVVTCGECDEWFADRHPDQAVMSRAAVAEIHNRHQPPHPSTVGSTHQRSARVEWDRWAALNPYRAV